MFSLESPHRGDSYKYTQYTLFNMKKKNTLKKFPRSSIASSKQRSKRAISVRVTEVLLYLCYSTVFWRTHALKDRVCDYAVFVSMFLYAMRKTAILRMNLGLCKSRKETPQKLTQLSSRSHPRHLVGKRTAQKDITIDTTSDSQVNSNFPNRWSPASLTFNNYFYLFLYVYIT